MGLLHLIVCAAAVTRGSAGVEPDRTPARRQLESAEPGFFSFSHTFDGQPRFREEGKEHGRKLSAGKLEDMFSFKSMNTFREEAADGGRKLFSDKFDGQPRFREEGKEHGRKLSSGKLEDMFSFKSMNTFRE